MGDLSLFGRLLNNVLAKMDHFGQFLKRIQFSSENCLGNFLFKISKRLLGDLFLPEVVSDNLVNDF